MSASSWEEPPSEINRDEDSEHSEEEEEESDDDVEVDEEAEEFDALVKGVMNEDETEDRIDLGSLPFKTDRFNPLLDLPDEQLVHLVEDVERQKCNLEIENMVYEHFLEENDSTGLVGLAKYLTTAALIQDRTSISSARRLTVSTLPTTRRASSIGSAYLGPPGKGHSINLTQKTDLVLHEMEKLQSNLTKFKRRSHLRKCRLKAELEEMALRQSELSEAFTLFETNIAVGAIDKITQRIPADKFIRFIEEWLKSARRTIDKLRLRTSSLKIQYQKVSHQLTQKQMLGENLQEVDFEQLQIENKHLVEDIDYKTTLLIELKRMNGTTNLALNNHKKLLMKKQNDVKALEEMIRLKENKIEKLDRDCEIASDELDEVREKFDRIKEQTEMYKVPDVLDYVRKKAELDTLRKNVKAATRTKQIKEMALAACVRELKHITGKKVPDPAWFSIASDLDISNSDASFEAKCLKVSSQRSLKQSQSRSRLLAITLAKK